MKYILNPFSDEAKRIVKESPLLKDPPKEIFQLAKKKVAWMEKARHPPRELVEGYPIDKDILSFYVLYKSTAINFSVFSGEVKLVKDVTEKLINSRLRLLVDKLDENYFVGLLRDVLDVKEMMPTREGGMEWKDVKLQKRELYAHPQHRQEGRKGKIRYLASWKELTPILRMKEAKLTDWDIRKGFVLLSLNDLMNFYSKLIAIKALDHITELHEGFLEKKREVHESLKDIGASISKVAALHYKSRIIAGISKRLDPGKFPPCIGIILNGVSTGSRNYAISVLLTSFLSYARIAPSGRERELKISDYIKNPKVLTEEILPMIYQAAERCGPPLFEDQPLEKLNISYHLGLGLTEDIRLESSGSSRWYFPPNCEKIRRESPYLCKPDETCKNIKNPLTYYFIKLRGEAKERGESPTKKEKEEIKSQIKAPEKPRSTIIDVLPGSGLIIRCPECKRVMVKGMCVVHADVEGYYDLRVKAKSDDGRRIRNILLTGEATEKAAGISLEEAKEIGESEALKKIKESMVGKTFEIKGTELDGGVFLVKYISRA